MAIIESFYQMYKAHRDLIASFDGEDLSHEPTIQFLRSIKSNCDTYDKSDPTFLNRWLKQREDYENESRK